MPGETLGWQQESAKHSLAARGFRRLHDVARLTRWGSSVSYLRNRLTKGDISEIVEGEHAWLLDEAIEECDGAEDKVTILLLDSAWLRAKLKQHAVPDELHQAIVEKVMAAYDG